MIYIVLVLIGLFLSWMWLEQRRRAEAVRAIAARKGYIYLGSALPKSLRLGKALPANATSFWNVIDGEPNGIRVIAFDCRFGSGKGSWRRTVIAVDGPQEICAAAMSGAPLIAEQANTWTILYEPRRFGFTAGGLMSVSELEARLQSIRATPSS